MFSSGVVLPSNGGASGGIVVMWDKRVVEKLEVCMGDFMVASSIKNVEDGYQWAFSGVYVPNLDIVRRLL